MPEDGPVESDEKNSEWIEDGRVNDEDKKRRGQPTPGGGCVQSGAEYHVSDPERGHQYQRQGQHGHAEYCAGETTGAPLRWCGAP